MCANNPVLLINKLSGSPCEPCTPVAALGAGEPVAAWQCGPEFIVTSHFLSKTDSVRILRKQPLFAGIRREESGMAGFLGRPDWLWDARRELCLRVCVREGVSGGDPRLKTRVRRLPSPVRVGTLWSLEGLS